MLKKYIKRTGKKVVATTLALTLTFSTLSIGASLFNVSVLNAGAMGYMEDLKNSEPEPIAIGRDPTIDPNAEAINDFINKVNSAADSFESAITKANDNFGDLVDQGGDIATNADYYADTVVDEVDVFSDALAKAAITLRNTSEDTVNNNFAGVVTGTVSTYNDKVSGIVNKFSSYTLFTSASAKWLIDMTEELTDAFTDMADDITDTFTDIAESGANIDETYISAVNNFKATLNEEANIYISGANFGENIADNFYGYLNAFKNATNNLTDTLTEAALNDVAIAADKAADGSRDATDAFADSISGIADGFADLFDDTIFIDSFADSVAEAMDNFGDTLSSGAEAIADNLVNKNPYEENITVGPDSSTNTSTNSETDTNKDIDALMNDAGSIEKALDEAADEFTDTFLSDTEDFIDIFDDPDSLVNAVSEAADTLADTYSEIIKESLNDTSEK